MAYLARRLGTITKEAVQMNFNLPFTISVQWCCMACSKNVAAFIEFDNEDDAITALREKVVCCPFCGQSTYEKISHLQSASELSTFFLKK